METTPTTAGDLRTGDLLAMTGDDGITRAFEVERILRYQSGYCTYVTLTVGAEEACIRWRDDKALRLAILPGRVGV